jgi:hypothetical protein
MGDFSMIKTCTAIAVVQSGVMGTLYGAGLTSNIEETRYRVNSWFWQKKRSTHHVQTVTSCHDLSSAPHFWTKKI